MSGRLIATIVFFNERELLPGCIESLEGADEIVLVDGAYADFPHESAASTDGTLEWIKEMRASDPRIRLIAPDRPWVDEVEKRNSCFVGKDGDWYLQIDADERVVGTGEFPLTELKAHLASYPYDGLFLDIESKGRSAHGPERYLRVYRHLADLQYEMAHFILSGGGRYLGCELSSLGTGAFYSGLHLAHLKEDRSPDRSDKKDAYYRRMALREAEALKAGIVERWNRPRDAEYWWLVNAYLAQLGLLDESDRERAALDQKRLLIDPAELPHA